MDRRGAACISGISIHAPRAGSDMPDIRKTHRYDDFNPRSPCGERRSSYKSSLLYPCDFNPRSPCGERHLDISIIFANRISIHAPRAGSDLNAFASGLREPNFNPRSPCGERPGDAAGNIAIQLFQSTLPVRGATKCGVCVMVDAEGFQSTLPVRGATCAIKELEAMERISIHAPRAGSDANRLSNKAYTSISIHAPRAGSDYNRLAKNGKEKISIHAPRAGSDPDEKNEPPRIYRFQSTLPVRGATHGHPQPCPLRQDFNPRSPCGERRDSRSYRYHWNDFNPRSPCGERQ